MNIVITGASGFLGNSLKSYFVNLGYNVVPIYRNDFNDSELLQKKLNNSDVIINLAGESIIQKWNKRTKNRILASRILTTAKIVDYLNHNSTNVHYINASAIGIYANNGNHNEFSSNYSNNFLSDVVKHWELEASNVNLQKNLFSIIRIGIVLGNRGGAFPKYYKLTKFFLNGIVGRGFQGMSYIHIDDFCNALEFIIKNKVTGIINITSPYPVSNKIFVKTLGKLLKRPIFPIIPKFIFKIVFGKAHILFTEGQYVIPKKLIDYGFRFKYSNIGDSFEALIKSYPK